MAVLLIEPASIARLVRLFLAAAPPDKPAGDALPCESREEAGTLLWDISVIEDGAAGMLGFRVLEATEAVLTAALEGSASARDAELSLGILANLAAFPRISSQLLGHAALAQLVCEGVLQQLTDPPALSEACRLLAAVCNPQLAAPWASRLCTMPVLERLLWIATNTLDATLQQRCLELLSALLQAQQSLAPAVMTQGLPAVLVEALTGAAQALVPQFRTAHTDAAAAENAQQPDSKAADGTVTSTVNGANASNAAQHSSWSDEEDDSPKPSHTGWTDAGQAPTAGQPSMGTDTAEALACAALACLQELGGSGAGRAAVAQQQALGSAALQLLRCEAAGVLGRLMVALTLHEQALLPRLAASADMVEALSHAPTGVDAADEDALDGAWFLLAAAFTRAAGPAAEPAAQTAAETPAEAPAIEETGRQADPVPAANGARGAHANAIEPAGPATSSGNGTGQSHQLPTFIGEAVGNSSTERGKLLCRVPSMASRLSDSPLPTTSQHYAVVCCQHMLHIVQQAMAVTKNGGQNRSNDAVSTAAANEQLEAAELQLLSWRDKLQQQLHQAEVAKQHADE